MKLLFQVLLEPSAGALDAGARTAVLTSTWAAQRWTVLGLQPRNQTLLARFRRST